MSAVAVASPSGVSTTLRPWPDTLVPVMRKRADTDLFFFCRDVLGMSLLEEEPHGRLCRWMQRPSRRGKRLILMPRVSFKTSIISFGYMLWRLVQDPNERHLLDSDLRQNSKKLLLLQRQHLEGNERLRQLYGDLTMDTGWTEEQYTVRRGHPRKEPSVMTAGMDQVVVMLHFDRICCDDLVNNTNVVTKDALEKTSDHIRLLYPLMELPAINPHRELVLLGTRWDADDAYATILKMAGWDDQAIEAALDQGEAQIGEWDIFFRAAYLETDEDGRTHYLREDGEGLFSLFTPEFLTSQRSSQNMGAYLFAANMLNNPVPSGDATFRRDWFKHWSPPLPPLADVVMAVDPAMSEMKHGDYSAIIVGGMTPEKDVYLLDAWKQRVNPRDLVHQIFFTYENFRPRVVGIETVAFQKSIKYMLEDEGAKRGVSLPIKELKPDTQESKEMRIRSVQPLYEDGRVYHTREMATLELELLKWRVTRKRQPDDLADALAYLRTMLMPPYKPGQTRAPLPPENATTGY